MNFLQFVSEKLVLKKQTLENGNITFVVDSDLGGYAGNNETYRLKDSIKNSGLFYYDRVNLKKWISKEYSPEEYKQKLPTYVNAVSKLNGNTRTIGDIVDDLEDVAGAGYNDRVNAYLAELREKLKTDIDSPEIKEFLAFRKKFRRYSLNNQILIWIQKPDATAVAGMTKWKDEFGRTLKKGAKGIQIFVPKFGGKRKSDSDPQTDEHVDEIKSVTGFMLRPVYDVSDTEPIPGVGKEIPQVPKWFDDMPVDEKTSEIFDAMLSLAKKEGISIDIDEVGLNGARGVSKVGSIQLMAKNISTMAHELGHEFLHDLETRQNRQISRNIKELQAEGVAYLVLREFGLPYEHTTKYLALWDIDPNHVRENESAIQKAANHIIDYIYDYMMEDEETANKQLSSRGRMTKFEESFRRLFAI